MDSSGIRVRLLDLARMRLANRWGAFEDFRNMLDYTSEGMKLLAQAQLLPLTIGTIAFQVGGTSRANEHFLGLIDAWAEKHPPLDVEPLPAVRVTPVPQASKAPLPISPLRGASLPPSRSPQPAKWQMWSKMPVCALWEAVCLTFDIEPDGERHGVSQWLESKRGVPYGFPADFADRLRVAQANVSTKGPIEPVELRVGVLDNPRAKVRLSDVARFAHECGWQIPDAMRTLADSVELGAKAKQSPKKTREIDVMHAPVDTKAPQAAAKQPKFSMNRSALIQAHKHEWPSIERDLKDASENGLSAAKAGPREWFEADALEWARGKGKLINASSPANVLAKGMSTMASLPGRRHTLKD